MANDPNYFNNPYLGNLILGGDKVYRYTPDCIVALNGSRELHTCQFCKSSVDLHDYITSVNVDAGVAPTNGSGSLSLAIPRDFANCIFRGNKPLIALGMEVNIYMRGYFPVSGLFKDSQTYKASDPNEDPNSQYSYPYYPVFHGVIRDMDINYSEGFYSVNLSLASILSFWTHQKMSTSGAWITPGGTNSALNTVGNFMGSNFTGKNPYTIIYEVFHSTFGAADGMGFALDLTTNIEDRSSVDGQYMFAHAAAYWAKRFTEGVTNLRMFGANGRTLNGLQQAFLAQDIDSRNNLLKLLAKGETTSLSQQLRKLLLESLSEDTYFISEHGSDITLSQMVPYVMDLAAIGEVNLFEAQAETKMDVVNRVMGATGYEFFQDVDGDMVFKPPFYNMNVKGNRVYTLNDEDIISIDLKFKEPNATYITTKGSHIQNINIATIKDEWGVRSDYYDWKLIAKFGFIPTTFDTANINDSRTMYFSSINRLDVLNKDMESGTVTIPMRPEMRVGYPVYIPHLDSFYYVEDFNHSFSYGGRCTTTLRLCAKRGKFFPPSDIKGENVDLSNRLSPVLTTRSDKGEYVGVPNVVLAFDGSQDTRLALKSLFALDLKAVEAALKKENIPGGRDRFKYSHGEFVKESAVVAIRNSNINNPPTTVPYENAAYLALIKLGYNRIAACAILGNFWTESGMNPYAVNDTGEPPGASGLYQLIDQKGKNKLRELGATDSNKKKAVGSNGKTDVSAKYGELPGVEAQIELLGKLVSGTSTSPQAMNAKFNSLNDLADAAVWFSERFERGAYWEMDSTYHKRIGFAQAAYYRSGNFSPNTNIDTIFNGTPLKPQNKSLFPPSGLSGPSYTNPHKKGGSTRTSDYRETGKLDPSSNNNYGLTSEQLTDLNIILTVMTYLKSRGIVNIKQHNKDSYVFSQKIKISEQDKENIELDLKKSLEEQKDSILYFIKLAFDDLFGKDPTKFSILGDMEQLSDLKASFRLTGHATGDFRYFSSSMEDPDDQGILLLEETTGVKTDAVKKFNYSNRIAALLPEHKPTKGFRVVLSQGKKDVNTRVVSSDQIRRISFSKITTNTKKITKKTVVNEAGRSFADIQATIIKYLKELFEGLNRNEVERLVNSYYTVASTEDGVLPFDDSKFNTEIGYLFKGIKFSEDMAQDKKDIEKNLEALKKISFVISPSEIYEDFNTQGYPFFTFFSKCLGSYFKYKNYSTIEDFVEDSDLNTWLTRIIGNPEPLYSIVSGNLIFKPCNSSVTTPSPIVVSKYTTSQIEESNVDTKSFAPILPVSDEGGYEVFGTLSYGRGISILNQPLLKNLEESDVLSLYKASGALANGDTTKKTGVMDLLNQIKASGADDATIKSILAGAMNSGNLKDYLFPNASATKTPEDYLKSQGSLPSINYAIPLLSLKPKLKSGLPCVCNLPEYFTEEIYGGFIEITPDNNIVWKDNTQNHYHNFESNVTIRRNSLIDNSEQKEGKSTNPVWFAYSSDTDGVSPDSYSGITDVLFNSDLTAEEKTKLLSLNSIEGLSNLVKESPISKEYSEASTALDDAYTKVFGSKKS